MKTNEQTQNELLMKESLILKGVASNLLSMQFPKFKNLEEMFSSFNYDVKISEKMFEPQNSVVAFFLKHKDTKSNVTKFDYEIARKNGGMLCASLYSGILKKITLCENTMSLYMNSDGSKLIDFDTNHERYFRIISFLSERNNILASDLPIFRYNDITYSIDELVFKNENELYDFTYNCPNILFVYVIKIYLDGTIILRGKKEKNNTMLKNDE